MKQISRDFFLIKKIRNHDHLSYLKNLRSTLRRSLRCRLTQTVHYPVLVWGDITVAFKHPVKIRKVINPDV